MSALTIRVQALDGSWEEIGGSNRARGIWPEGVGLTANEWGSDTARFILRRDPGVVFPDLTAFTPVEVEVAGVVCWAGFIWETPAVEGADRQIGVECRGYAYHLDDDVFQRVWVHAKLTDWKDHRSDLAADLTIFKTSGSVEVGTGGIVIGWPKGAQADNGQHVGVTLDLGPDSTAKRVVVETEAVTPSAAFTFRVRGHDQPSANLNPVEDIVTVAHNTMTTTAEFRAATFATAHRYLTVFMHRTDAASGATANDHLVRLRSIKVFRDPAFEAANASVLRISTVVKDALTFAPLLDQATDEIDATSFDVPDFALSEDRTPREVIDAGNALHRWRARVKPSRKLAFGPQPTVPLLRVGEWAGVEFKDASRNSGQEIYNRALVTGQGPDGNPLKLSRYAAQQPGGAAERVSSPALFNPSFDADLAAWSTNAGSTLTRDTTVFDTSPASGRWDNTGPGDWLATSPRPPDDVFVAGRMYRIDFRYRSTGAGSNGGDFSCRFGATESGGTGLFLADSALVSLPVGAANTWYFGSVAWMPRVTTTFTKLQFYGPAAEVASIWVDTFTISVVKPTLPDRRGFLRTKVLQIAPALNEPIAQQFADAYLAGHMRAPLKGSLTAHGPAVRQYLGDAPVHPAHLLLHTTELVHLSHMIDPDTGHLGRDAPIATVSYDHDDQRSDVAVDETRESFEALVARYAAIAG